MLTEFHQTAHQVNYHWTEEQIALYFRKRNERLNRMAEEIKKLRSNESSEQEAPARRVTNEELFARMKHLRSKGGSVAINIKH